MFFPTSIWTFCFIRICNVTSASKHEHPFYIRIPTMSVVLLEPPIGYSRYLSQCFAIKQTCYPIMHVCFLEIVYKWRHNKPALTADHVSPNTDASLRLIGNVV